MAPTGKDEGRFCPENLAPCQSRRRWEPSPSGTRRCSNSSLFAAFACNWNIWKRAPLTESSLFVERENLCLQVSLLRAYQVWPIGQRWGSPHKNSLLILFKAALQANNIGILNIALGSKFIILLRKRMGLLPGTVRYAKKAILQIKWYLLGAS